MRTASIVKGSLFGLLGFFFMAVFGILTKLALREGSFIWVSFLAYLTGALCLAVYIAPQGIGYLKSTRYSFLIGRALFGTAASFLYTISLNYIPIVNGTLLFNTAPIFIPLLALVFLHSRISTSVWIAVLIGFCGIIFIIKPSMAIFTQPGNLIGLASGMSLAVAYLLMKLLTDTDPPVRIILYYLGLGTLVQAPLLMFGGAAPSWVGIGYAVASGAVLLSAQMALVTAYRYADASQVGIYQYSSVVFVGLFDWLLWGVVPTLFDFVGVVLVAVAGITIIRSNNKKSQPTRNHSTH